MHNAVIARFDPYLYPLDVSYQNVNEAKVVLWLVGYKKEMVDVDLKMFRFVMLNVPCQQNDNDCGVFIMKFMDNWSNGGLSKSIDVSIPLRLQGFYRFSFETPTFNAIAAISWLQRERRLPLGHRASALLSHLSPVRRGLTSVFSLPGGISEVQAEVCPEEVTILEPIFPTLVRAFYSRVTYGHGGPIISTIRGVQIKLDPESLCRILDIALVRLRIDVGYLMMMHMMVCCESFTCVFPYDRFLTRVFKDAGVDLSREQDFEAPSSYDTYVEQSLGRMKFEKALDGSWIRRAE
ncbi:hypothetical protein CK203_064088 [Vitis vinifera]|uniref:Ubiquitin-like protease family profile domain-containing protein n=1 Tax=Vitis vinifera TaxID=29760 RepID=A0A438G3X6_VITVI|nr:hypothetical protein CK203_064088 [Vitis vinifera]